jgi:toxin-antitoxin system PIN domain toxin
MRALLDVNMLLALFDPAHTRHQKARVWWGSQQNEGWASCPLTQNGFLRIISKRGYPRPLALVDAMSALRAQIALSSHTFWPDDISIADPEVFDHGRILGPNQLADIYLLALAVRNDGRLATFDRTIPMNAVRGAESHHLVAL